MSHFLFPTILSFGKRNRKPCGCLKGFDIFSILGAHLGIKINKCNKMGVWEKRGVWSWKWNLNITRFLINYPWGMKCLHTTQKPQSNNPHLLNLRIINPLSQCHQMMAQLITYLIFELWKWESAWTINKSVWCANLWIDIWSDGGCDFGFENSRRSTFHLTS